MSVSRRSVLAGLVSVLPTVGATTATASIEPEMEPGDLVVISCDEFLSQDSIAHIRHSIRNALPENQPVLIMSKGMSLSVHRGVVKVEMPNDRPDRTS